MKGLKFKVQLAVLGSFLLFAGACKEKDAVKRENAEIRDAAAKLNKSSIFYLNTSLSEIDWELTGTKNSSLKGRFSPERGTIILENGQFAAGYWSGNLWKNEKILENKNTDFSFEKKAIIDSTPVLSSTSGQFMQFDLLQASRYILRSDYHTGYIPGTDTSATHILQGNLTIADSTLAASLTAKVKFGVDTIEIQGQYTINYTDFGIGYRPGNMNSLLKWNRAIPIRYRLIFNTIKK